MCLHLVQKCRDLYRQAEGGKFLWMELLQHPLCTAPRQLMHTIKPQILIAVSIDPSPDNVTWKKEKKLT